MLGSFFDRLFCIPSIVGVNIGVFVLWINYTRVWLISSWSSQLERAFELDKPVLGSISVIRTVCFFEFVEYNIYAKSQDDRLLVATYV